MECSGLWYQASFNGPYDNWVWRTCWPSRPSCSLLKLLTNCTGILYIITCISRLQHKNSLRCYLIRQYQTTFQECLHHKQRSIIYRTVHEKNSFSFANQQSVSAVRPPVSTCKPMQQVRTHMRKHEQTLPTSIAGWWGKSWLLQLSAKP